MDMKNQLASTTRKLEGLFKLYASPLCRKGEHALSRPTLPPITVYSLQLDIHQFHTSGWNLTINLGLNRTDSLRMPIWTIQQHMEPTNLSSRANTQWVGSYDCILLSWIPWHSSAVCSFKRQRLPPMENDIFRWRKASSDEERLCSLLEKNLEEESHRIQLRVAREAWGHSCHLTTMLAHCMNWPMMLTAYASYICKWLQIGMVWRPVHRCLCYHFMTQRTITHTRSCDVMPFQWDEGMGEKLHLRCLF